MAAPSFRILAAAAAIEKRPLIVSIHDVAPPTRVACGQMIDRLARHGVNVCSLLVVPDYHQSGASMADGAFVRWLRDLEAAGHEIVLHGFFHQRPRRAGETWREKFITRTYTSDEGEFHDLAYDEAFRRITEARRQFLTAGLHPKGFIAPAWLLNSAGEQAAADAEMEYTTRLTTVLDLRTRVSFHSRSMVYSVRSGWRRMISLVWNAMLAQAQVTSPLVRLGLHPPDISHQNVWDHILGLTQKLSAERRPTTYRDWIGEQRILR
ncbi:MAG: polysaccharide deacetylase family protein [Chthoniobacterales bacterium]